MTRKLIGNVSSRKEAKIAKRFDLDEMSPELANAANHVVLHTHNNGYEVNFSQLFNHSSVSDLHHKTLISRRNDLMTSILADTNPLIDGATRIKGNKSQLADEIKSHTLNPGKTEKEKADIARGFADRMASAIIKTLPPELQAGMSYGKGQNK